MTSLPIISGIATAGVDFNAAYPVNLVPVPASTGISEGFLRPAEGIVTVATAGGVNRGGYQWNGVHYRVQGTQLVSITAAGVIVTIGPIDGINWCTFAESFDYLAINGGGKVYLYNGAALVQITDIDLGTSLDVEWINGYFMSTDGAALVVTDITDPFSVNPLRYGSSEVSPDPVVSLMNIRNEIYAINRYSIEVYSPITNPGVVFPFQRNNGAQIMKGAFGSRAVCEFMQTFAFMGGGPNEPPAIWIAGAGSAVKLSTREIDGVLRTYTDAVLTAVVLESRIDRGHEYLYIHLPDQTLVYDGAASQATGAPVWFVLKSEGNMGGYRARGFVWCYGRWNVADPFGLSVGYLSDDVGSHYGDLCKWMFSTPIAYNEGRGIQIHELELVSITGEIAPGDNPLIATEYSLDGKVWSQPKYIKAGKQGDRDRRLTWDRQGSFRNWRIQRFSGDSRARMSFARLEARIEALAV